MISWILYIHAVLAASDPQLETLVKSHESGVGLIHTLDMEIDFRQTSLNGNTDEKPLAIWWWTKQGRNERHRYVEHTRPPRDDGKPLNRGDALEDGTTIKVLTNYDWDDQQPLHPHEQGTMKAWFGPQDRVLPSPFPNPAGQFAMFQIQMNLQDSRKTLRELVRDSPKVTVKGKTTVGVHQVWHLHIEHPDTKNQGFFSGSAYDVYLEPAVNFMVRKVFLHIADVDPDNSKVMPMQYEREVVKFQDFGDGVFVPVDVICRMYTAAFGKAPVMETRAVAKQVNVNQTLPARAFDFRWPENALVVQFPPKDNQMRVTLWGPNNQAGKPILSQADLGPMPRAIASQYAGSPAASRLK